jgi:hypothetical protein
VFSGATVSFIGAVFSGGWVRFTRAEFATGWVGFTSASVTFSRAEFIGGACLAEPIVLMASAKIA